MTFKPNKAATCDDVSKIVFPAILTPKIDGIRGTIQDGVVLSNSLKPIVSKLVQARFACDEFEGLDGELVYGDPTAPDVYTKTFSAVMSIDWPSHLDTEELRFYVFDRFGEAPYKVRLSRLIEFLKTEYVVPLAAHTLHTRNQLLDYEHYHTTLGYEGVMGRSPIGNYKQGRSTMNEGGLWKLKRFEDAEAVILGFKERMHNGNEATTNELGNTARSSHKAGKVGLNTLGALCVRDVKTGIKFDVGTGLSDELRQEIWDNCGMFNGRIIVYKFFPVGVKEKPRHPVFKGFRDPNDMSGE